MQPARMVANCKIASTANPLSVCNPNISRAKIRWPDEDTGRNSVRPWTSPKIKAEKVSINLQKTPKDKTPDNSPNRSGQRLGRRVSHSFFKRRNVYPLLRWLVISQLNYNLAMLAQGLAQTNRIAYNEKGVNQRQREKRRF